MSKKELIEASKDLVSQEMQGQTDQESIESEQDRAMSEARFQRAKKLTLERRSQQLMKTA